MKRLLVVVLSLVFVYLLGFAGVYFLQEKFIFLDDDLASDYVYDFEEDFTEFDLEASDGAKLNALHFKADSSRGVIVYFHGNQGNLTRWGKVAEYFVKFDHDVVIMDYRGYGKSTGKRSLKKLFEDAELFYQYAIDQYGEDQVTIYGRSLGTGIASYLAGQHNPKRLILETPYYSMSQMAQRYYPIYPSGLALKYKFQSFKYLHTAKCPIFIFHGTEDEVVPYSQGLKLHESLPEGQSQFYTIEGGEHKNLSDFPDFSSRMRRVLHQEDEEH